MPYAETNHKSWIVPVKVSSVNSEKRLVGVQYLGTERGSDRVIVVTPPGNYSMPKIGDTGLVISTEDERKYYVGTYFHGYADYLEKGKIRDKDTGIGLLSKQAEEGEIFISSLARRVWMLISRSGDFSLMNGFNEGLRYFKRLRFLRLASMFTHIIANGSIFQLGSVARDLSGGKQVVPSDAGPSVPALEALIKLIIEPAKLLLARFHIGHVKDNLGRDEVSSWKARLRAILEIANPAGVPIAVLKMDETGNIELSTIAPGVLMLNGSPISGILLGGLGASSSVVRGEALISWLNSHIHPTPSGASSPPTVPADSATILSPQVKVS